MIHEDHLGSMRSRYCVAMSQILRLMTIVNGQRPQDSSGALEPIFLFIEKTNFAEKITSFSQVFRSHPTVNLTCNYFSNFLWTSFFEVHINEVEESVTWDSFGTLPGQNEVNSFFRIY